MSLQDQLLASVTSDRRPVYAFKPYTWRRLEPSDDDEKEPVARSGHRMVYHDDRLVTFGGFNPGLEHCILREVWEFSLNRRRWSCKLVGDVKPNVASHAAVVINDNDSRTSPRAEMLVYGGTGYPFGYFLTTKIFLCSLSTFEWKVFHPKQQQQQQQQEVVEAHSDGDYDDDPEWVTDDDDDDNNFDLSEDQGRERPFSLYGQSVAVVDGSLYTVGGTNGLDYTMDVDRFSFGKLSWEKCYSTAFGSRPMPRYRHEICTLKGVIYVLGGGTESIVCDFIEVWCFDTTSKAGQKGRGEWRSVTTLPDPTVPILESGTEQYPASRRCFECVQMGKHVYIFGGFDGQRIIDDAWRLDLESLQWTKLPCPLPEPVYFSSSAISPGGQVFVMGGVCNIEEKLRSNKLHTMWADVASLRDMSWEAVQHYLPKVRELDVDTLRTGGIPRDIIRSLKKER